MTEQEQVTMEELRRDVDELRNLLKKMACDFKEAAKAESNGRLNRLRDRLGEGIEYARNAWDDLQAGGKRVAKDAERQMGERPIATALTALVAGAVLGAIIAWRRR